MTFLRGVTPLSRTIQRKTVPSPPSLFFRSLHGSSFALVDDEWKSKVKPTLKRISENVTEAIRNLRYANQAKSSPNIKLWSEAFDVVEKIASSSKKSLFRPQLVLVGFAGATNDISHLTSSQAGVLKFATGIELQHLFMLIQDDMMDNASFRRGEETLRVAISRASVSEGVRLLDQNSIRYLSTIVGDMILAKSMELMFSGAIECGNNEALSIVLEGTYRVGAAQFEDIVGWSGLGDVEVSKLDDLSKVDANSTLGRLVFDKASFHGFVAPLIAGSRLARNTAGVAELEETFKSWGLHAGAAFQALDDIADLTCSPSETGKDQLQDIQEGRLSLPLLILKSKATASEWADVTELLTNRRDAVLTVLDRQLLVRLVEEYKLIDTLFDLIDDQMAAANKIVNEDLASEDHQVYRYGLNVFNHGLLKVRSNMYKSTQDALTSR